MQEMNPLGGNSRKGDDAKKLREVIISSKEAYTRNQIDTNQIIYPWLKPWIKVIDMVKQDTKAFEFADKAGREPREDSISSSRSIFDFFKPAKKLESNIKPKLMLQRLFDPFDMQPFSPTTTFATANPSKNDMFTNALLFSESTTPHYAIRINSLANSTTLTQQTKSTIAMPSILTLLESFGHNYKRREEVEVGRDRTINVLGMPVGRKDGISLAPLRGLSVGNEDMFGPIAINNKYNINWGFFNDLGKVFNKPTQQQSFRFNENDRNLAMNKQRLFLAINLSVIENVI
ncbi:unnamed protein product [Cercopithifilaria johnstoni]|uniref:Uncharacterized protein n=1 Tax=Cercopithifilaria johnstoni TaxID=2874296 RepID=A0A8J2LVE4_9BILA|nr:unnamed protein product [Cercopithifilaria johnstoni]